MTAPKAGIDFLASNNALIASANELVVDSFLRADNASSWGTPDETGTAWTHPTGTAGTVITNNRGLINALAGNNTMLSGATAVDAESLVRFTTSSTTGTLGSILRATGTTTFYRAVYNTGNLKIQKSITGTVTLLGSAVPKTITAGAGYWIRFRIQGASLQAKMWADGLVEPIPWDITIASDTSITTAGQTGLMANLNSASDTMGFDHIFTRTLTFGYLDDPVDFTGPTDTETDIVVFHPTDAVAEVETPLFTKVFSVTDSTPIPTDAFSFSTVSSGSFIVGTDTLSEVETSSTAIAFNAPVDIVIQTDTGLNTQVYSAADVLTTTDSLAFSTVIVPVPLVLYGSSVADGTLTTANSMAQGATGGTETSKTITIVASSNQYAEILSQGGSTTDVASIPATPTGHGWIYTPGAGAFAAASWLASFTMSILVNGGTPNVDTTIRFFKYSSGTYTLIGTINVKTPTLAKTTYTFSATAMPATTFVATDRLYIDLWYHDQNTNADGDNPTIYESTSTTAGVANDIQITTSSFTPSATTITATLPDIGLTVTEALQTTEIETQLDTVISTELLTDILIAQLTDQGMTNDSVTTTGVAFFGDALNTSDALTQVAILSISDLLIVSESIGTLLVEQIIDSVLVAGGASLSILVALSVDSAASSERLDIGESFTDSVLIVTDTFISSTSTNVTLVDSALFAFDTAISTVTFVASDVTTSSEGILVTLVKTLTDSLLALSESLVSSVANTVVLTDTSLAAIDSLTSVSTLFLSDILTSNDGVFVATTLTLPESALFAIESLLEAFSVFSSDTTGTTEIDALLLTVALPDVALVIESLLDTESIAQAEGLLPSDSLTATTLYKATDVLSVLESITSGVATLAALSDSVLNIAEAISTLLIFSASDSVAQQEVVLDLLTVSLSDSVLVFSDTILGSLLPQSFMLGTDQLSSSDTFFNTLAIALTEPIVQNEILLATLLDNPVDQLGTIFDQSTTTGVVAPIEQLIEAETLTSFAGLLMSTIDQLSVIESLVPTPIRLFFESVTTFDVVTSTVQAVLIDVLVTLTESIASFSGLNIAGIDTLALLESTQSTIQWNLVDNTPAGEGLAALPFALNVHLTDTVNTIDAVQGAVTSPLFDSITLPFDVLGTTFTLTFTDTLVSTDAAFDVVVAHFTENGPASTDSLAFVNANPLFTDQLVPLDSLHALVFAPFSPDTLQLTEQLLSVPVTFGTAMQRVRSGVVYMIVRSGVQTMRVRSGNATMATRTGRQLVTVRSGNVNETTRQ